MTVWQGDGHIRMGGVVVAFVVITVLALPASGGAAGGPIADVHADLNHDGVVSMHSPADQRLEHRRGAAAIVLPNLDDDANRCPRTNIERYSDRQLASCNDASDNRVDGRTDLADMAPIRVRAWQGAPAGTRAHIAARASQPRRARIFLRRGGAWKSVGSGGEIPVGELRRGPRLRMEARDVVRDRSRWNGSLHVVLRVQAGGHVATDSVRFRVAPVLFQDQTMPLERVFAAKGVTPGDEDDPEAANIKIPNVDEHARPIDERTFAELNRQGRAQYRQQWRAALKKSAPHVPFQLLPAVHGDRWMQDFYEPGYVSMPAPHGRQHTMTIVLRSATKNRGEANPPKGHLMREGSRIVYSRLRGPGIGVVQAYDAKRMRALKPHNKIDTMSSTGNFEAVPPFRNGGRSFPNGRMIWGAGHGRKPDPNFTRMLRAQGTQKPLVIDTSWLTVGHVDEFISFVPTNSPRGWTIAVEDPHAGIAFLKRLRAEGHGNEKVFRGLVRFGDNKHPFVRAARTVDSVLTDPKALEATRAAAHHIHSALAKVQRATGIPNKQIIRVPTFYARESDGFLGSEIPATVNGVPLKPGVFVAPRPHGPIIGGGDAFEKEIEKRFAEHGVRVRWVEDWYFAHLLLGEVHCTSNVLRDPRTARPWWLGH
jgi:protein-arginine deiminase